MSGISGLPYTKPYYEKIGVMCPKCGDDIVVEKTKKEEDTMAASTILNVTLCHGRNHQKRNVQNVAEQWLKKEIKLCAWMNNVVM